MPESNSISFTEALGRMKPVTLEEMGSVKLMNRIDTKYLTNEVTLLEVLADAALAGYRVLTIGDKRISGYDSVYYDTPEFRMYYAHRNKHLVRQKVRTRAYLESGQAFLEIKRKNNKGRTKKKRTEIPIGELMDFGEQFNYFRIIYKKEIKYGDQITACRQNADGTAYFLLKDQAEQPRAIIECR